MDLAWISLAALLLVMVASCTSTVNAGLLSIALAWIVGIYVAGAIGQPLEMKDLVAGFPTDLCLTLIGVTLLFSQAQVNGTLERVARFAVRGCRGDLGLVPIMFFVLSVVLSSVGAGNIAGTALIAPLAMTLAHRAKIPAFLMAILVAHGALAGAVSPLAPTGIIADKLMHQELGLSGFENRLYLYNLAANAFVGLAGYLIFGGWRLFGRPYREEAPPSESAPATDAAASGASAAPPSEWTRAHVITLLVIGALIVGVVFFQVHVGMGAFAGAVLLTLCRAADERKAMQMIPWGVILMVCGVTVLTSLLDKTGGLDRFAKLVSQVSTPQSVPGVSALLSGILSVYSSTSGVVLPALLPTVPKLLDQLGGGDPFAVACSVVVSGHVVDSSPLSTIGALCIASAPALEQRQTLFNQMLAWGLAMAVVGAIGCYVFFGLLGLR
ncbi:MAG TPA: SLC13 family permease [Pirellulaceae bacterium]|nr:SLC13 family permease [Pirellulaceae bacterium]